MKELVVILSSTWKFAATFPIAVYVFNMSFFETIFYTNVGGLLGIIAFTLIFSGLQISVEEKKIRKYLQNKIGGWYY